MNQPNKEDLPSDERIRALTKIENCADAEFYIIEQTGNQIKGHRQDSAASRVRQIEGCPRGDLSVVFLHAGTVSLFCSIAYSKSPEECHYDEILRTQKVSCAF